MEDANAVDITVQVAAIVQLLLSAVATIVSLRYSERRIRRAEQLSMAHTATTRDRVLLAGVEGPHLPRIHGQGILALSDDRVTFISASVPHRILSIPRAQIVTVDLTSAMRIRGHWKRNRRHWLRIRWHIGTDVATIGVIVPNPAMWANILTSHLSQPPSDDL